MNPRRVSERSDLRAALGSDECLASYIAGLKRRRSLSGIVRRYTILSQFGKVSSADGAVLFALDTNPPIERFGKSYAGYIRLRLVVFAGFNVQNCGTSLPS